MEHFIYTLKYDVRIVGSLPEIHEHGKIKKMKAFQVRFCEKDCLWIFRLLDL